MTNRFKTFSPVDGSVYVERAYATNKDIDTAFSTAQKVIPHWRNTPITERAKYCTRAVDALIANKTEAAEELCWQMGRPIRYTPFELTGFEDRARYMIDVATTALSPLHLPEKENFIRFIKREPLGIVFVIAPWNYPYLTAVNSIIPAIMAGNVVLLKHSAQTPLVAERLAEAFDTAGLPQGVFQYLHLTHADAEECIRSAPINHIAFTGSVSAGKTIEQVAAGRFLSLGLELGGKDPAYIRADAHLKQSVETVIDGAFFNSGQSCCGIERIYVHHHVFDDFVHQAVELIHQYKLGRPDDPKTTLGPLVSASAADFVRGQIHDALAMGAIAEVNPNYFPMDKPGSAYMAPQLLTHVTHQMRVMTEESFGPVVGVMSVYDDEEAIELMNDSQYGLTAAVFSQDIPTAIEIGERLQTGTFFINRCDYLDPALAWTGIKQSGRGCTLSTLGYETLTRPKSFHIKKLSPL